MSVAGPRSRRHVGLAIVAAVLVAAGVAVALALARPTTAQTAVPAMVAGPGMCAVDTQVWIDLDTDYEMGQVVAALHGDRRVAALAT